MALCSINVCVITLYSYFTDKALHQINEGTVISFVFFVSLVIWDTNTHIIYCQ